MSATKKDTEDKYIVYVAETGPRMSERKTGAVILTPGMPLKIGEQIPEEHAKDLVEAGTCRYCDSKGKPLPEDKKPASGEPDK